MKFFVETYGCQMNSADSEEMSQHLFQKGITPANSREEADIVLLNTCTVREHAENRALSFIGRLEDWKKKKQDRYIIVAGCAAERLKDSLKSRFPHVDLVVGAKNIESFAEKFDTLMDSRRKDGFDWFAESAASFNNGNSRTEGEPFVLGKNGATAFVTIMRGCNYSCSYCIVPSVRGREIYRAPAEILTEIQRKVKIGAREVLLLGQTVNSYWHKQQTANGERQTLDFADLLEMVSEIADLRTIRFMSPHPHYMTEKLVQTLSSCEKISPQIHLPVQSGSNKILKAMKRNYTRAEYAGIVLRLQDALPKLELSTDFIVGFPGETEDDFVQTLSLARELPFRAAYCFKYSARAGTESARLTDDVPRAVKEERLSRLLRQVGKSKLD